MNTGEQGAAEGTQEVVEIPEGATQESIAAEMNAAAELGEAGTGDGDEGAGGAGGAGEEFKVPIDEDTLSTYSESLGVPIEDDFFKDEEGKPVTKKVAIQRLNKAISVNEQTKLAADPFINQYLQAKSKDGFDKKIFIDGLTKNSQIEKMPSKEFLSISLKEEGYNDDQINNFFKSKTDVDLDLLAKSKKQETINEQTENNKLEYNKVIERKTQELEASNATISSKIKQYGLDVLSSGKHPLKMAKGELEEVVKTMEEMSVRKIVDIKGQKYEVSEVDAFLGNNDNLLKVYPFIALEKLGKLDSVLKKIFTELKDNEFEKIDSSSSMGTGGSQSGKPNWAKLMK